MSIEASASISESWANLEGHVVDGVFPLHRYLGGSDLSGVFLSASRKQDSTQVALKLIPVAPAAGERLSRWRAAMGLHHPHLLRLLESGRCQLGGALYLYVVMEYADQNLAQLLERRALTEEEAREMMAPVLSALGHVHDKGFVHAGLKPSNVLVVGDQLKLASDTIRPMGEVIDSTIAGDVLGLGVTVCEALTRRSPSGLRGEGSVELPAELPAAFREMVTRCVSRKPQDRPRLSELAAWTRGEPVFSAPTRGSASASSAAPDLTSRASTPVTAKRAEQVKVPPAPAPVAQVPATSMPAPRAPTAQAPAASAAQATSQVSSAGEPSKPRIVSLAIGVIAIFAATLAIMRTLGTDDAPPSSSVVADAAAVPDLDVTPQSEPTSFESSEAAPQRTAFTPGAHSAPVENPADVEVPIAPTEIHQEIPEVPSAAEEYVSPCE
jgi:serine/threonine protein kinase